MSIEVPRVAAQGIADVSAIQPSPHVIRAPEPTPRPQPLEAVTVDTLPTRPPSEVMAQVEAAGQRYEEMRANKRELHFRHDETANRVVVEVRDLDGNVLRTVPPSRALEIIAGGPYE
jgi:flagellar protein FlaG